MGMLTLWAGPAIKLLQHDRRRGHPLPPWVCVVVASLRHTFVIGVFEQSNENKRTRHTAVTLLQEACCCYQQKLCFITKQTCSPLTNFCFLAGGPAPALADLRLVTTSNSVGCWLMSLNKRALHIRIAQGYIWLTWFRAPANNLGQILNTRYIEFYCQFFMNSSPAIDV